MNSVLLCRPADNVKNAAAYVQDKEKRFYSADTGVALTELPASQPVPIAPEESHPTIPDGVKQKIAAGQACALKDINARFSLAPGESFESDSFSYLTAQYGGFPKNTVVLTRKTNLATCFIILPGVTVDILRDATSQQQFVSIVQEGRLLYPVPPPAMQQLAPREDHRAALAAAKSYAITSLKVISASKIEFGWSVPEAKNEWWGLYRGVMPSWDNLNDEVNWNYVAPKGTSYGKQGTQTVSVTTLKSGNIYTFALFGWKWDLGDYQQFTAP
jgi:hypothetical protein